MNYDENCNGCGEKITINEKKNASLGINLIHLVVQFLIIYVKALVFIEHIILIKLKIIKIIIQISTNIMRQIN